MLILLHGGRYVREADVFHQSKRYLSSDQERIFNVRKVPYKEYDHEKCNLLGYVDAKANFSPLQKRERMQEPSTSKIRSDLAQPKKAEYVPLAITSSAYKELAKKYQAIKEESSAEKERRMQVAMS